MCANVVFIHGFSEHVNRYNEFFPKLAAHGLQIYAWDKRGYGKSVIKPSQKGLTGPTSQVVADIAAFVREKLQSDDLTTPPVPLFVMGYSIGGGEALLMAADNHFADLVCRVRGWILESPFIGFPPGQSPNRIKIAAVRLLSGLAPSHQVKHRIPPDHLSRDAAVANAVRSDPLCHYTGTLEGLSSLLDRTAMLSSGQVRLSNRVHSIFLAHGTDDRQCSHDAAMKFIQAQDAVEDKTWKSYEGGFHQLHQDYCKDEFAQDVVDWILQRIDTRG